MADKHKHSRRAARTPKSKSTRVTRRVTGARKRKAPGGLRTLYPTIEPYHRGMLRVSAEHELYFEECGNPQGKPAIFIHGGPGAGCDNRARSFFDPNVYRIVLFDQRGCGRSKPHAPAFDNRIQGVRFD